MKRKIVCVFLILSLLAINTAYAQEQKVGAVKQWWRNLISKAKKEGAIKEEGKKAPLSDEEVQRLKAKIDQRKPPSKEDMLDAVLENLDVYSDELTAKIPNIILQKDEKGAISYKYKKENTGELVDIKDLDEETLSSLYGRVMNESTMLRTERINKQIQQIRPVQAPVQIPRPVVAPPQPPRVYTPPKVPSPPPQLPQQRR
jgi:hypothetical protein